jgi:hypothetical protein
VQVTGVVPTVKNEPDGGVHVGVAAPVTWSTALRLVYVTATPLPVAATVMSGDVNTGPTVSTTVTVKLALDECANGSNAVHVTVVVHGSTPDPPSAGEHVRGKVVLGCGEQTTVVPGGPASSEPLSTAVGGRKKTVAPAALVA